MDLCIPKLLASNFFPIINLSLLFFAPLKPSSFLHEKHTHRNSQASLESNFTRAELNQARYSQWIFSLCGFTRIFGDVIAPTRDLANEQYSVYENFLDKIIFKTNYLD